MTVFTVRFQREVPPWEGSPPKTSWARGDVQFIGRGVPHESKNTGGKPVNFILIAIR